MPLSLRVQAHGIAHLDQRVAATHRIVRAEVLAVPRRSARQEAEADPVAEAGEKATDVTCPWSLRPTASAHSAMKCAPARSRALRSTGLMPMSVGRSESTSP